MWILERPSFHQTPLALLYFHCNVMKHILCSNAWSVSSLYNSANLKIHIVCHPAGKQAWVLHKPQSSQIFAFSSTPCTKMWIATAWPVDAHSLIPVIPNSSIMQYFSTYSIFHKYFRMFYCNASQDIQWFLQDEIIKNNWIKLGCAE